MTEQRPWGSFTVLEEGPYHKLKKILVKPGQKLSYQSHSKRKEVWTITYGFAVVTLDGVETPLMFGQHVIIPVGTKHRIENASSSFNLEFIEVQQGDYFGEDDIVRYEDVYGRV
jgi:mannose-6-phosphate isomerase-like protein (cupin superfamily)